MTNLLRKRLVNPFFHKLDSGFSHYGLIGFFGRMVIRSGARVSIRYQDASTEKILQKEPAVVVFNHPYGAEFIALVGSLPERKNISVVVDEQLMGLCPAIDTHLIPVSIRHHSDVLEKWDVRHALLTFLIHPMVKIPYEAAHKRNVESIGSASQKISEGNLVIYSPEGSHKNKWQAGIGYLLNGVNNPSDAYYITAHIDGVTRFDYLRVLPIVRRIFPKIRIVFGAPVRIVDVIQREPKQTVSLLEERYNGWVKKNTYEYVQKNAP